MKNILVCIKSTKEMANHFWLPSDNEKLLEEVNKGNELAAFQLLVKYMPDLLEIARELSRNKMHKEEAMAEVMQYFIENIAFLSREKRRQNEKSTDRMCDYLDTLKKQLRSQLSGDKGKVQPLRFNLVQTTQLNHLNNLLRNRQNEIARQVEKYVAELEHQVNKASKELSHYEIKIFIRFYKLKSSHPIHTNTYYINLITLRNFMEKFDDSDFDWWTDRMPVLDQPCCYLFAELFEHWQIIHCIPEIAMVWSAIGIDYEHCMLLIKGKWKFVSKYDSEF